MTHQDHHLYTFKENLSTIGKKAFADKIDKGNEERDSAEKALKELNVEQLLNKSKDTNGGEETEGKLMVSKLRKRTGSNVTKKKEAFGKDQGGTEVLKVIQENSGAGLDKESEGDCSGPVAHVGPEENNLISFDMACRLIKSPKRKKKKAVANLGRIVENSKSYYSCIAPRKNVKKCLVETAKCQEEMNKTSISQKDGQQQFSGESISSHSLTDSGILRCNLRLVNSDNSDVGRRVWDSISNLGVVGREEVRMSVKLIEAMERRDKEKLVGKKEFNSIS